VEAAPSDITRTAPTVSRRQMRLRVPTFGIVAINHPPVGLTGKTLHRPCMLTER
jgi:hypothetical protein